jgi:carboxymethylenebutenolidase
MGPLDEEKLLQDIDATLEHLADKGFMGTQVGIVGFCFGGSVAFVAAARRQLGAAITFYGARYHQRTRRHAAAGDAGPRVTHTVAGPLRRARQVDPLRAYTQPTDQDRLDALDLLTVDKQTGSKQHRHPTIPAYGTFQAYLGCTP